MEEGGGCRELRSGGGGGGRTFGGDGRGGRGWLGDERVPVLVLWFVLVVEGLVDKGGEGTAVVILFPWGGVICGDECGDDVDDGGGVKVEASALLLGLEMWLGGGVGGGRVWGALLGGGGGGGGVVVGMGDVVVEEALEVVEGAVLGDGGRGRDGGAGAGGGEGEGDAAAEAGAVGGVADELGGDRGRGRVHGGEREQGLHGTGGEHRGTG